MGRMRYGQRWKNKDRERNVRYIVSKITQKYVLTIVVTSLQKINL